MFSNIGKDTSNSKKKKRRRRKQPVIEESSEELLDIYGSSSDRDHEDGLEHDLGLWFSDGVHGINVKYLLCLCRKKNVTPEELAELFEIENGIAELQFKVKKLSSLLQLDPLKFRKILTNYRALWSYSDEAFAKMSLEDYEYSSLDMSFHEQIKHEMAQFNSNMAVVDTDNGVIYYSTGGITLEKFVGRFSADTISKEYARLRNLEVTVNSIRSLQSMDASAETNSRSIGRALTESVLSQLRELRGKEKVAEVFNSVFEVSDFSALKSPKLPYGTLSGTYYESKRNAREVLAKEMLDFICTKKGIEIPYMFTHTPQEKRQFLKGENDEFLTEELQGVFAYLSMDEESNSFWRRNKEVLRILGCEDDEVPREIKYSQIENRLVVLHSVKKSTSAEDMLKFVNRFHTIDITVLADAVKLLELKDIYQFRLLSIEKNLLLAIPVAVGKFVTKNLRAKLYPVVKKVKVFGKALKLFKCAWLAYMVSRRGDENGNIDLNEMFEANSSKVALGYKSFLLYALEQYPSWDRKTNKTSRRVLQNVFNSLFGRFFMMINQNKRFFVFSPRSLKAQRDRDDEREEYNDWYDSEDADYDYYGDYSDVDDILENEVSDLFNQDGLSDDNFENVIPELDSESSQIDDSSGSYEDHGSIDSS